MTAFQIIFLLMTPSAHAYIDPSSGSILLQLILGGIGSLFLAIKGLGKKFKNKK